MTIDPNSPEGAGEAEQRPGQDGGEDLGQGDLPEGSPSRRPQRPGGFLLGSLRSQQHRLDRAHDERVADEEERQENARLGEDDLHAVPLEPPSEKPAGP